MNSGKWFIDVLSLAIATIAFDLLFWESEGPGSNLIIFSFIAAILVWVLRKERRSISATQCFAIGSLLYSGAAYLFMGSAFAAFMLVMSVLVLSIVSNERNLRSLTSVLPQLLLEAVWMPWRLKGAMEIPFNGSKKTPSGWRWIKLGFVPVLIVALYIGIYRNANPRFGDLTAGFVDGFIDLFEGIFTGHTVFVLFGLILSAWLIFRNAPHAMYNWEQRFKDTMVRHRMKRPSWMKPLTMNALEKERQVGLILLSLMNVLLLILNFIDMSWIWFGFEVPDKFDLKQFVHEGTWLLMLSILMSIAILLYLFRQNQNFHPDRKPLQLLAYAWIAQNFILGISVFIRNYHYMSFHGLAYKRIGVVIFLALVLFGLLTMVKKIKQRKTGFHLLALNSWAAFILLVLASGVDWDQRIANANLTHGNPAEIDIDMYLKLDARTYPLLYENLPRIEEQMKKHGRNDRIWVRNLDIGSFKAQLDTKRDQFIDDYESSDFRTKTLDMERTYKALKFQNGGR